MGFTRFLKDSDPNGIGVHIIDESVSEDIDLVDYYEGIYSIRSYGSFFDVTFIPEFKRKTDLWYQDQPCEYEDVNSSQEARLLTAIDREYSVTPDAEKAGTKQKFVIPLTSEREAEIREWRLKPEDFIHRTIYYVTPREFYTFRGEIITILTERNMGHLDLINLKEILDFSFIQFILKNVMPSEKLELLWKKAGIDSFMRKSILI